MTELRRDPPTTAALARLYDVDLLDDPGDIDLYLALAARTGGPILELATGSGRIAVPLARAGYEVTAVDIDPAMLARLRRRLAETVEAEPEVRGRVHPVEGDLVGLELPGGPVFGLAILALNSVLLLDSRDRQRAALETMARYLVPGGVAVVDVWLPAADELARYDGRLSLEYARTDPETELVVTKTVSAEHEPTRGHVELTAIYEEGEQGGPPRRWVRHDRLRLLGPDELSEMAEAAGLIVEVLAGSYDLEPLVNHDERAILIARRRGRTGPASLL
ncbi:MAG: class I SAM-dependent methyltransferase [Candidatus Limnocylindrales bacterium]|jgi:SAM-dependent methyltransferase